MKSDDENEDRWTRCGQLDRKEKEEGLLEKAECKI